MNDDRDPIIDVMLDELLGGQSPPDLKQRILAAYRQGSGDDDPARPRTSGVDVAPRIVARRRKPSRRKQLNWSSWSAVALLLVAAVGFLSWVRYQHPASEGQLAQRRQTTTTPPPPPPAATSPANVRAIVPRRREEALPSATVAEDTLMAANGEFDYAHQTSPTFQRELVSEPVWQDDRMVAFVDQRLSAAWKQARVDVAEKLTDRDWFVRTYQLLLGTRPTSDELRNFERRDPDRESVVTALLERPEFARRWSRQLADVLVGQFASDDASFNRKQLEEFLDDAIGGGKSYDQLVFELLTAVGSNDPRSDNFNPAVNFLLAYQDEVDASAQYRQVATTDVVCQVFLGQQLQCARCHDHPIASWTQQQYWQMASFFVQLRKQVLPDGMAQLGNYDYPGNQGTPEAAELSFQAADGTTRAAFPVFLDGREAASRSGIASEFNRREAVARMIVASDDFSKVTVNRIWDQAFGLGMTYPVDDLGPHNVPNHPELLERLAAEFENSGFKLRSVLRWLVLSAAFNLEEGETAHPELFHTYAKKSRSPYPFIDRQISALAAQTLRNANLGQADEVSPTVADEAYRRLAVASANKLLNGSRVLDRIAQNPKLSNPDRVDHLFLFVLGRLPTSDERTQCGRLLEISTVKQGLQEIGAVLVDSQEFALRH